MLAQARHHIGLVLGPPDSCVSSIHVADAAAAVAAALHAPAGTFNVVDNEPLTKRQYAAALADAAGQAMWLRGPGRAALLFGDRLTSLTRSLRVSNARFRNWMGTALPQRPRGLDRDRNGFKQGQPPRRVRHTQDAPQFHRRPTAPD